MRSYMITMASAALTLLPQSASSSLVAYPKAMSNDETVKQRTESTAADTTDQSVYICQNFNWEPPCMSYPLPAEDNNVQLFWQAPAPGGPGPFRDDNYTIGSWGPSTGVTTYWVDHNGGLSEWYTFPGTGDVDGYWGGNIWTFYAFWDGPS